MNRRTFIRSTLAAFALTTGLAGSRLAMAGPTFQQKLDAMRAAALMAAMTESKIHGQYNAIRFAQGDPEKKKATLTRIKAEQAMNTIRSVQMISDSYNAGRLVFPA